MRAIISTGSVPTLCRQCDMHCGIDVHIVDGTITKISGQAQHPQNRGRICPKAPAARELVYHPDRLLTALKRRADNSFEPIAYPRAMVEIAAAVARIKQRHGARSLGVWTGEAIGFFQQADYARRFVHALGSPNYFSAESVCFASRYIAACLVQGFYTPVPDFARAKVIVLWGINPGITHLPYMLAIESALKKGARLIVIDPRRTAIATRADLFVQIQPGTDGALAWGLARGLIASGQYDHDFVTRQATGFKDFARMAHSFSPTRVAAETGVSPEALARIVQLMGAGRPKVVQSPGIALEHQVNGVNTLRAIACLTGLCGAVDVPGGEVCHQPPVLQKLPLYDSIPLDDQQPIGAGRFPILYGMRRECHAMTAIDYMLGKGDYPLRGLIISGANPVLTNPNSRKVVKGLEALDLLVVRDLFQTPTSKLAHYVLPAATFLERSELHPYPHLQRLVLTRKVLDTPEVTDEYTFWHDLAHQLGLGADHFPWPDETAVNRWLLSPSGIALSDLAAHPRGVVYGQTTYRKYRQRGFATPSGKFEFASPHLKSLGQPELPVYRFQGSAPAVGSEYPFTLITGARNRFFYHSRYHNIQRFRRAVPEPTMEIHPVNARRLGIHGGQRVKVVSATGEVEIGVKIMAANQILPGVLQIPHGWKAANVNRLTDDTDVDPIGGLPNMKVVRVRIEPLSV